MKRGIAKYKVAIPASWLFRGIFRPILNIILQVKSQSIEYGRMMVRGSAFEALQSTNVSRTVVKAEKFVKSQAQPLHNDISDHLFLRSVFPLHVLAPLSFQSPSATPRSHLPPLTSRLTPFQPSKHRTDRDQGNQTHPHARTTSRTSTTARPLHQRSIDAQRDEFRGASLHDDGEDGREEEEQGEEEKEGVGDRV